MSYVEGQAIRLMVEHRFSADTLGCRGCDWQTTDEESAEIDHIEHVVEELADARLFVESRKSVNTLKAEALYEAADEICICEVEMDEGFHTDLCASSIIITMADRLK